MPEFEGPMDINLEMCGGDWTYEGVWSGFMCGSYPHKAVLEAFENLEQEK